MFQLDNEIKHSYEFVYLDALSICTNLRTSQEISVNDHWNKYITFIEIFEITDCKMQCSKIKILTNLLVNNPL